jgi:DNA-binding NtrC family response regulator
MAKVLLVEKDAEMADIFSRHLHVDDHDLRIARSFTDAITIAATFVPEILIIDGGDDPAELPVAKRLCRTLPHLKIIIWGGEVPWGAFDEADLTCTEIFAKSTSPAAVRTAVARLAAS